MEVLHDPPNASSFVPLAEHQSRTPASFYSGPPILHHLSERCKIVILERELSKSTALAGLKPSATASGSSNGAAPITATVAEDEDKEIVIDGVDVWVTSERLLLYSQPAKSGVAVPYPSISLHAIQRLQLPDSPSTSTDDNKVQGLYMQLATDSNENEEDEDMEEDSTCLTIVPPAPAPQPQPQSEQSTPIPGEAEENKPTQSPTQELFAAVSACSNLHPDLQTGDGDEENDNQDEQVQQLDGSVLFQNGLILPGNNAGGLPPAMPGSGGWITAENMHEYFDEEGNWKAERVEGEEEGSLGLGPGAGTVRQRDGEGEERGGEEAGEGTGEETKWRRTD
ncbi:hypothetical protein FQN55_003409 [Onygenales sp. PD_40]|nr:hypothetical protein FQN55_003409 [Onygenales sp. PD_40]KAK2773865.1 hypothetical protein FQN53_003919 [Emmonsiellopsis sp. PD_33]